MARIGWTEDAELNYAVIAIVDEASGDTLEIQRTLAPDVQDATLGMDTYCLVRGGASYYGGVVSYEIGISHISFSLVNEAATALQLPTSFSVPVDLDGVVALRERLPGLLS